MSKHVIHKHSSQVVGGGAKLISPSDIEYGELALNYAKGYETLMMKNSEGEIISMPASNLTGQNGTYWITLRPYSYDRTSPDYTVSNLSGSSEDIGGWDNLIDAIKKGQIIAVIEFTEAISGGDGQPGQPEQKVVVGTIGEPISGETTDSCGLTAIGSPTAANIFQYSLTKTPDGGALVEEFIYTIDTGTTYIDAINKLHKERVGRQDPNSPSGTGEVFNYYTGNSARGAYSHAEGYRTYAASNYLEITMDGGTDVLIGGAHAEGGSSSAIGIGSHAEGGYAYEERRSTGTTIKSFGTMAIGMGSHSEGVSTIASGDGAHAEGDTSFAFGKCSHAEGYNTIANGDYSHAEGSYTKANEDYSHAEGSRTIADGAYSHAEGYYTIASGYASHAEGLMSIASERGCHAEGNSTSAIGMNSHAEGYYTKASGSSSHAEGYRTLADGNYSHAEGRYTSAYGLDSHAEGFLTIASGQASHAEGSGTTAKGNASHAEGIATNAIGKSSHAEGGYTKANEYYSHAEGYSTTANGDASHAEGYYTIAGGNYSHAEGRNTSAYGRYSHAEGFLTIASGQASHAEGSGTTAKGNASHAEGCATSAIGKYCHAEGYRTIADGQYSHAEGLGTIADGISSHAEGYYTIADGQYSHAEGGYTSAIGMYSHVQNYYTTASGNSETAIGRYNKTNSNNTYESTNIAFSVGNGTTNTSRGNAFTVQFDGTVKGDKSYSTPAADYAEMFEWSDGNPDCEDRVGYFVTLKGKKIKKATSTDKYIVGVVSSVPGVIGDNPMRWNKKYSNDEWGRPIYEEVEVPYEEPIENEDGSIGMTTVYRTEVHRKLNPDWNGEEPYNDRMDRKEWAPVGLLGKLLVRQDGTLVNDSFCAVNDEGIATYSSNSGYFVMEVINDKQALILVK